MTSPDPALSSAHREYLNGAAISDEVIEAQGVRSDGDVIVFTWRDGAQVTEQRRPWPGAPGDYRWEAKPLHLNVAREPGPDAPALLCEGTKQHLAVASWAPEQYAVYGMQGCRGASRADLSRFAGRQVVIWFDADAAENLDVYEAGENLAGRLELEGAQVFFARPPSTGKEGIDDYLAGVAPGRRTAHLAKLAADAVAKNVTRPAARRPARRKLPAAAPDGAGLPVVVVNAVPPLTSRPKRDVIRQILAGLQDRWGGTELFCYGGVLTRLREARTEPLDRGAFLRWLSEGLSCQRFVPPTAAAPGRFEDVWPDRETVEAVMASADEFAPLNRVMAMPFIRKDGSACAKNGYDADAETFLALGNSGMDRLDIPDAPSGGDARSAAAWLLEEWLGDMPFRGQASRANALALVLTPFIRGLVPLVPLAVVSGLQIGVGKNLLTDCLSIIMTGQPAAPLQWIPDDDDEVRKQLLSAFRQGDGLICFDEAHVIGGAALSRALTAQTYTDRILGVSQMARFPNQATWLALGNQVQVNADMSRRVYIIGLHPAGPNPQDRPESAFRHPDLRGWTAGNRPELITALLVMVRAWFTAGCPAYPRGSLMGSFEAWDKMVSGILGYAEVPGFLGDLTERRADADFTGGYWAEHLAWSSSVFLSSPFTVLQVKNAALASQGTWSVLPGLDNLNDPGFARKLGQEYARHQGQWSGGFRLHKVGKGFNNVIKWVVEEISSEDPTSQKIFSSATPQDPEDPSLQPPKTPKDVQEGQQGQRPGPPTATGGSSYSPVTQTPPDLPEGQQRGNEINSDPQGQQGQRGNPTPSTGARARKSPDQGVERGGHMFYSIEGAGGVTGLPLSPLHPPLPPTLPPTALGIDLETASADELFRYTQRDETGFVRLAGAIGAAGRPVIMSAAELVPLLEHAEVIEGHNILGFDLIALARHHGADYARLAAKARDTELVARQADPPRSRESHAADSYDLDSVAGRLGLAGKSDDLARLKRKFGGWDKIPLDDPEYRAYLEGDLRATAAVAAAMRERYPADPYLDREHKLAAIAGRMTLNGFRVDAGLLGERLAAGQARKRECLQSLHDGWGLPLTKTVARGRGKGKTEAEEEVTAPLATDAGRRWLAAQYERYGVADPPRTANTGKLAIGADELAALAADPRCDGALRSMLALMGTVTATRTVYQTAADCLTAGGRVHPGNSFRQASGRWSVTNPGLTVFGKRGGRHVERDIFLPDEGHVLLSFDLSQVDMRAMAGHSQDPNYMALFAPGRDAHQEIADQVGLDRQSAKAIGHGWNYGLGATRMIANGLDPGKVAAFIAGMEARFPALIAWRGQIREQGRAGEVLDNGWGRRMRCDPARAFTVAPALMGQGGARDIMCESLLRMPRELDQYLRVMVHDEVLISVPKDLVYNVIPVVKQAMTWEWRGVPITCDMSFGVNWGDCSK